MLRRTGHTEATIDLARLAGLYPAGVLTEILNEDGSMARLPQLMDIAKEHDLKLISIKDLVAYRMKTERLVEKRNDNSLKTKYGEFNVTAYRQINTDDVHVAISMGNINSEDPILTKVHSNTETGDILGIYSTDTLRSCILHYTKSAKKVKEYYCTSVTERKVMRS